MEERKVAKTVCAQDCPDACSVLVSVEGGRAVSFAGDPAHPVTRGFLCGKVNHFAEVVESPDRLLHPLRRTGPKGSGRFERTTWEAAIAETAARIDAARRRHGGEALLQYYYAGTMGYVHRYAGEALFHRLGATRLRLNICYYGADAGYNAVVGGGYGVDMEDAVHSDLVIVWGANPVTTQVHLMPFIDQARKRGARLYSIDAYRNRTAAQADLFLQVRPGSDPALALSLMHVIEREGLLDRRFIESRTVGWERLRDQVLVRYPPERAAEITGIEAAAIESLAREYARARSPLIKVGIGLGRSANGGASLQAIACLAGAVGAWDRLGGGVLYDSGCEFRVNLDAVRRPDWLAGSTRVMNMTDLARALTSWDDPPIEFLYVHGSNPAATAPEQERLLEGLRREDLFTVVHERFLTDTALHADLVLPAPTWAETDDLLKSYGHLYLQMARAAIPPRGESRPNLEVIQAIGRALGFDDPWFRKTVPDLVRDLLRTDDPNFRGVDPERVLAGEMFRLNVPRGAPGFGAAFRTPSGKLEFASQRLEAEGLPPLPDWRGDPYGDESGRHPFRLITPPAHHFLHTSFPGDGARRRMGGEPRVLVHPEDAGRAGVEDGEEVELSNELGACRLVAQVTEATQPGVLVAESVWWPSHSRGGRGINALTSARLTDLGGGSTFHDNRVAMARVGR